MTFGLLQQMPNCWTLDQSIQFHFCPIGNPNIPTFLIGYWYYRFTCLIHNITSIINMLTNFCGLGHWPIAYKHGCSFQNFIVLIVSIDKSPWRFFYFFYGGFPGKYNWEETRGSPTVGVAYLIWPGNTLGSPPEWAENGCWGEGHLDDYTSLERAS